MMVKGLLISMISNLMGARYAMDFGRLVESKNENERFKEIYELKLDNEKIIYK